MASYICQPVFVSDPVWLKKRLHTHTRGHARRPTKGSVLFCGICSPKPVMMQKSVPIRCQIISGDNVRIQSHVSGHWCAHVRYHTGRGFSGQTATSSSYPPSSDSMTKVPTLGMATSTVRWPADSSSCTRSGGGSEGVLTWTSGGGEEGGWGDCRESWTDETEDSWKASKMKCIGMKF